MKIHPQFQLNGHYFTGEELKEVAYSWVKEGKPFEISCGDFLLDWLNEANAIQVKTSGSTGAPKTITLQKKHMVNSARATGEFFNLLAGDSALQCLSADYIAGKMMMVRAMVLGLHLHVVAPSASPLEGLKKPYDFCAMVPLQVQNSISQLGSIKKLIIGGAPVSPSLRDMLKSQSNKIYETYGMTETITHIALKNISNGNQNTNNPYFETLADIKIEKDNRGCLVIDAPTIASQKVVTNDLIDIIDENRFEWLGRYDNIINSGGVKLIPEVIERKLATIMTNPFFITGVPDEKLGEKVVLVTQGKFENELPKLASSLGLNKFEVPKEVYELKRFVEVNSKISRKGTLEQFQNRFKTP